MSYGRHVEGAAPGNGLGTATRLPKAKAGGVVTLTASHWPGPRDCRKAAPRPMIPTGGHDSDLDPIEAGETLQLNGAGTASDAYK